jgi:hypothetical protein
LIEKKPDGSDALAKNFKSDLFPRPPFLPTVRAQFGPLEAHDAFLKQGFPRVAGTVVRLGDHLNSPGHGRSLRNRQISWVSPTVADLIRQKI